MMGEAADTTSLQSGSEESRRGALRALLMTENLLSDEIFKQVAKIATADVSPAMRELAKRVLQTSRARIPILKQKVPAGTPLDPEVCRQMLRSPEACHRQGVAEIMAEMRNPALADIAAEALEGESDGRIAKQLLRVIGANGNITHLEVLRGLLGREISIVSIAALQAIEKIVPPPAPQDLVRQIIALERDHPCPDVRFTARRLIHRYRRVEGERVETDDLTVELVQDLLASTDDDVRANVVSMVRKSGNHDLAEPIAHAIPLETVPRILSSQLMALKELGQAEHCELIRGFLSHPDVRVCANAVEALVALTGSAAIDALFPLLARDDDRLRANLMIALYSRYEIQVTGYVKRMLRSGKVGVRASGLYCVAHLDVDDIYDDVLSLLARENEPSVFARALRWCEMHAPPKKAMKDLEELAGVRARWAVSIRKTVGVLQGRLGAAPGASALPPGPAEFEDNLWDWIPTSRPAPIVIPAANAARAEPIAPMPRFDYRITGVTGVIACLIVFLSVAGSVLEEKPQKFKTAAAIGSQSAKPAPWKDRSIRAQVLDVSDLESANRITVQIHGLSYQMSAPTGAKLLAGQLLDLKSPRFSVDLQGHGILHVEEIRLAGGKPKP